MKVSFVQILFRARSALAALWVLLLLVFSSPSLTWWAPLLFLPGLVIRFWAAGFIGPVSRSSKISSDRLCTRGPYSLFRHPLYIGNALLVAAGLILVKPHWILTAITAVAFITLYILLARAEERKLIDRYGDEYLSFRKRVTPFFPLKYEGPLFSGFNFRWAMAEYQTWIVVGLLWGLAFVRTLFPGLVLF